MNNKGLFREKYDCCGCEACALSCPKHIISMQPDEEGFLYPLITEEDKCINCGRCIAVCPVKKPGRKYQTIQEGFGGYVLNQNELKLSASGGFATAISKRFIQKGGIVYGVRYSGDYMETIFSRASCEEELELFRTSKYSQARKGNVFSNVLSDLKTGLNVLFIGLPCEISALYHYVGNHIENLYTVALICHGPTSPKVHRDFCETLERKNSSSLSSFSLRYKLKGWKPYYIKAEFKNGKLYQKQFDKTTYGIAFQYLKRPSCHMCKYKSRNTAYGLVADLTIGDFHSAGPRTPYYNAWGVSQLSVQSPKGEILASSISETCFLKNIPSETLLNNNIAFHQSIPAKKGRRSFVEAYITHSIEFACHLPQVYFPYKKRLAEKSLKKLRHKIAQYVRFFKRG